MKKTNPLSIKDISKIANNLRLKLGYLQDEAFPILEVLELFQEKNLLTIQFLDDNDPILEKDIPVKYNYYDNFIYIKESVLEELENKEYRSNFTLAHELFHFIQFNILNFSFEEVEYCKDYERVEWQANEFAGQLLLPSSILEDDVDLKTIANKYKVSEICAITRKLYYLKRKKY